MQLHEFVSLLEAKGCKPRQLSNGQWQALCPAHDDTRPSLSVTESEGRILVKCFADCTVDAICAALGISVADLFDRDKIQNDSRPTERILAVYDYCDATGRLLFQTVRFEPKRFAYRQPDNGSWRWTLEGVPRPLPLYRLPDLLKSDPQKPVFVVEGEKDADNLWQHGLVATTNPMGAGKWAQVDDSPLEGRHVVILPDNDEVGRKHAEQVAQSLYGRAASVRIVHLPNLPPKGDVSDWLSAGHTIGELLELVSQTPEWQPPRPPSLAEILDAIRNFIRQYVVLTDEQADAVTLWVAHTWVIDATDVTPYLRVNSATKRSGKTRLAEVIACLANNPRPTTCISTAALFRLAHKYLGHMTLIVDEIEGTLSGKEKSSELTALLNAGWRRGLTVPRVERSSKGEFTVREYETFCPKVLVGLGKLADTVEDRAITIVMQRKRDDEVVRDFFWQEANAEAEPIRQALEMWASAPETIDQLRSMRPEMPRNISDRAREGWRILVAIADLAGNGWSERARKAMLTLEQTREDTALNIRLLAALRDIFAQKQATKLSVQDIAEGLQDLDDPPVPEDFWRWVAVSDWRRFGVWLARTLKPFGVKPKKVRFNGETKQGYELADFTEAFARYLPKPTSPQDPDGTPNPPQPEAEISTTPCDVPFCSVNIFENGTRKNQQIQALSGSCSVVPFVPNYVKSAEISTNLPQDIETCKENASSPLADPVAPNDQSVPLFYMENGTNGTMEQPQQIQGFSRSVSENQNGTTEQKSETNLPIDLDSGLEVKVVCKNCGSWRRVPPDTLMLTEPRCSICGLVMAPEPEDTNPPDSSASTDQPFADTTTAEPTVAEQTDSEIDTEQWIDQWWQEVLAHGDQPLVVDLETGEPTPVAFPNLPAKEAKCPRCGHRESVDPTVLLPPFCPACGSAMEWSSNSDPPPTNPSNDPLLDAGRGFPLGR
ncbi:Protein of unknown function (DUF3631) [Candidatus Fervidibacteria bacterium JGI MDM2 SSWTFF-3-K9]